METENKETEEIIRVRWMIRNDLPQVLRIERTAFEFPWSEEEFVQVLRQRNAIGMVAAQGEQIVGFVIYELNSDDMRILNLAVKKSERRTGIGRTLVERLHQKLKYGRRDSVNLEVRESNLPAQLFWKAMGYLAVDIIHSRYEDTDEDAYVMEYLMKPKMPQEAEA